MKRIPLRKIVIALFVIVVAIQFVRIDKTNPDADISKDFITITNPPENIRNMLKTACYDCHSYQTDYPWYTNISPVSWWIKNHINVGRKNLNFSTWADYDEKRSRHKLEECYEEVEEGEMPLPSYLWAHGDAKLSKEQREKLVAWFKQQGGF